MLTNPRWKGKLPAVQQNFVDPQGVAAARAAQQMQGYQPSVQPDMQGYQPNVQPGVRGMAPSQATQQANAALADQNYQQFVRDDAALQEKKNTLAGLEKRLGEVDAEIARIQSGAADEEKAIAARLASVGDMSAYNAMIARGQNSATQNQAAVQGLSNMLYEAEKLTWGLNSKSEEDSNMVRSNIEATLRRAREEGDRAGVDVTKIPSYQRLSGALGEADRAADTTASDRAKANEWWAKAYLKELTDADIADVRAYIAEHPDSDIATRLRPLVDQYAPKTVEANAAATKRQKDALTLLQTINADPDLEAQRRRFGNLTKGKQNLIKDFYPDVYRKLTEYK